MGCVVSVRQDRHGRVMGGMGWGWVVLVVVLFGWGGLGVGVGLEEVV